MKSIFTRVFCLLLCSSLFLSEVNASVSLPATASVTPDSATVKSALSEFRSLSARERRQRIRAAKTAVKEFKADKRAGREPKAETVLQVICAILLPPLGVYLHEGVINTKFWIDLVLTLLFFIPGMIYALIVVLGAA